LAQIPLLKGVNDSEEVLIPLLRSLSKRKVKGYYLLHGLPWTLGSVHFRTPVYRGVEILAPNNRHVSHISYPEYVIVARGGKRTVPFTRKNFWLGEPEVKGKMVWAIDDSHKPLEEFAIKRANGLFHFSGFGKNSC